MCSNALILFLPGMQHNVQQCRKAGTFKSFEERYGCDAIVLFSPSEKVHLQQCCRMVLLPSMKNNLQQCRNAGNHCPLKELQLSCHHPVVAMSERKFAAMPSCCLTCSLNSPGVVAGSVFLTVSSLLCPAIRRLVLQGLWTRRDRLLTTKAFLPLPCS